MTEAKGGIGRTPTPNETGSPARNLELYAPSEAIKEQLTTHLGRLGEICSYPTSLLETITTQAAEHLQRHRDVMTVYLSDEVAEITEKAQRLSGPAQKGKIVCIDGRESRALQDGKVTPRWSVPGALVPLTEVAETKFVGAGRLVRSIREMAKRTGTPDLLEFMKVHTASHAPLKHGCAAIAGIVREEHGGELPDDPGILIRRGIQLAHEREDVLLDTFNKARIKFGQKPLRRVTALGISDTDTQSFTLTDEYLTQILDTRELLRDLIDAAGEEDLALERKKYFAEMGQTSPFPHELSSIVPFEEANYKIALRIIRNMSFERQVNSALGNSVLADLTGDQVRALLYIVARNMASQYITGVYREERPSHPFHRHNEEYASVSLDGIHVGDYEPGRQALKASPGASGEIAHTQIRTQLAVMDKHHTGPHILYVTTAVPADIRDESQLNNPRAANYTFFHDILRDGVIASAVREARLIPVPVLLDEERRLVEITDPLY